MPSSSALPRALWRPPDGTFCRPTPINNFDLNVVKTFSAGERYHVELRADFYNALNHPQYTPGRLDNVVFASHIGETNYLTPGNSLFGKWDQVFPSNARIIQLAAKFSF